MRIIATENGPLQVDGAAALELYDQDETRVDVAGRDTVAGARAAVEAEES